MSWQEVWDQSLAEELERESAQGYSPADFYVSGRRSKAYPDKETPAWWAEHGPKFVKAWEAWRDNCGMDIWTAPDGKPAIELEVRAHRGHYQVLSVIDRVFIDQDDELYIIDLKSGSQTPAWPRQMALNNLGLRHQYGVEARYAGFWNPRKGGIVDGFTDIRHLDEEWMWRQVEMAYDIRDRGNFVAQPTMLCKTACGVRDYCRAMDGPLFLEVTQP